MQFDVMHRFVNLNFFSTVCTTKARRMQLVSNQHLVFNLRVIIFSFSFMCCPGSVLSFIVKCGGHGAVILICSSWSHVHVVLFSCIVLIYRVDGNLYCKILSG